VRGALRVVRRAAGRVALPDGDRARAILGENEPRLLGVDLARDT